jgi:hypothetical protein
MSKENERKRRKERPRKTRLMGSGYGVYQWSGKRINWTSLKRLSRKKKVILKSATPRRWVSRTTL